MRTSPRRTAFSLVELSIVLVILGLLAGGILAGKSLIRAAELRSVSADLTRYKTSYYSFRDKYFALPGDMTNATAFWGIRTGSGSVTGSDTTCHQTINVTGGTCNGDGDNKINYISGDSVMYGERFAAWQHLAYAGMVEGSYTGATTVNATNTNSAGVNVPNGKISSSYIIFAYLGGPFSGNAEIFDGPFIGNLLSYQSNSKLFTPEEMWNIDTKLDDGLPATGIIFTTKTTGTWAPGCATTDVTSTAAYSLASTSKLCNIWMILR